MQRALPLLAFALVAAVMGCAKGPGQGTGGLVGLSATLVAQTLARRQE